MSYQSGYYRKVRNLKVRPVPEMGFCFVFTPDEPSLFRLNESAWLIFELCDGNDKRNLERKYHDAIMKDHWQKSERAGFFVAETPPTKSFSRKKLDDGLSELLNKGIIEFVSA